MAKQSEANSKRIFISTGVDKNHIIRFALFVAFGLGARTVSAALTLTFSGTNYTGFVPGEVSNQFNTADSISGVITFDNYVPGTAYDNLAASSITLSTSVGGAPGFGFIIPDTSLDPRDTDNQFDFSAGSLIPTQFTLTIRGEVFQGSEDEQLGISDLGDFADIDFDGIDALDSAFNFTRGSFDAQLTAVPEPTSFVLMGVACSALALRYRRRKNQGPVTRLGTKASMQNGMY